MSTDEKQTSSKRQRRAKRIVEVVAERGRVSVDDLADELAVTGMTIRRDLTDLEAQGIVTRTHGGCVLRSPLTPYVNELPFTEKIRKNPRAKLAIACTVASLIQAGSSVYLDTGTTAIQIARQIRTTPCKIFTNNVGAALELFGNTLVSTIVFGGTFGAKSPDLYGEIASQMIVQYIYDLAILGGDALDLETGELYAADLETASLSRAAQMRSKQVVIGIDASKIRKTSLSVVRTLRPGDILVTDASVSRDCRERIASLGVDLRIAKGSRS